MGRNFIFKEVLNLGMSEKEIADFFSYQLTSADIELLKETATAVFTITPFKSFNCAAMNALWVAMIRDHSRIPVAPVTGSLTFKDKFIFKGEGQIPIPAVDMTEADLWDGHCWLEFGGLIADISLGRTLAIEKVDPGFKKTWTTEIDGNGRLVMAPHTLFRSYEIKYLPKFLMSTRLIDGLIRGHYS